MMTGRRILLGLVAASVLAAGAFWELHDGRSGNFLTAINPVKRSAGIPLPSIHSMSTAAADAQRAVHYQDLDTIGRIRNLPSVFARREALYTVAGRAGPGQLRGLISEAGKIPAESERLQALEIVLLRQVELSPQAALRSAMDMDRDSASRLVPIVLGAWSQSDLDAAVAAMKQLPAASMQKNAALAILANNVSRDPKELRQLATRLNVADEVDAVMFEEHSGVLLDDPHQAIADALQLPPDGRREQLLKIAHAWARISPEEAWEHAAQLKDPGVRWAFQNAVAETWLTQQPEVVFTRVLELPRGSQRTRLLRGAASELTSRNPRQAVALLASIEDSDARSLQLVIADEWSRHDVTAAAAWIKQLNRNQQSELSYQIAETYVTQQPEQALAWALSISRSLGKNLWSRMVGIIAQRDPDEAMRLAQSVDNPAQRARALGEIAATMAERDPERAMAQLEKLPVGRARREAVYEIAAKMGNQSAEAAIAWLDSIKDPEIRMSAAGSLMSSLMNRDIDNATSMLDRVPKDLRSTWLSTAANAYASADPERGEQWLAKFRDDPDYPAMLRDFAVALAGSNPEAALELVDRAADGKQRDELFGNVLTFAAFTAPEAATRWLDKISDPAQRGAALGSIGSVWLQYDPPAARKWILSQPSSPGRDSALIRVASQSSGSIDDKLSVIDQIQSPAQRMQAVMAAALSMRGTDPEGAATLLRRRPLDPGHQQAYEQMAKQPQTDFGW